MKRQFFGTDGVRGPYGGPVINDDFAARLGYAAARWLAENDPAAFSAGKPQVCIGRDTRSSGVALEAAVARGLRAGGAEPVDLGVLPTPAVARVVREGNAALGVVITASHNPAEDNGIKFFGRGGIKLADLDETRIEARLPDTPPAGQGDPTSVRGAEAHAVDDYIATAGRLLPAGALRGRRIVVDTANGATCVTTPSVLRSYGADVIGIGNTPDGANINAGVGSEYPALLAAHVRSGQAWLGIAHDGDGDRCLLCDERGEVLDGDEILTLLAVDALARGRLAKQTLVVTVQSNLGVDAAVAAAGGRVVRTAVGDRYVIERMRAEGFTLGGESSGHIVCSEISPTGDGLVAALKVIEVMLATGRPLSGLRHALKKFPQQAAALTVLEKKPLESLPGLAGAVRALEAELGTQGRVLVRWSGTETKLRLLVEGPTAAVVAGGIARLEAAARQELVVR